MLAIQKSGLVEDFAAAAEEGGSGGGSGGGGKAVLKRLTEELDEVLHAEGKRLGTSVDRAAKEAARRKALRNHIEGALLGSVEETLGLEGAGKPRLGGGKWVVPTAVAPGFGRPKDGGGKARAEAEVAVPGVTLSTIHGCKGSEWKHVFIVRANEGEGFSGGLGLGVGGASSAASFAASSGSVLTEPEEEQEEARRVLYVAMSRARETLAISCAWLSLAPAVMRGLARPTHSLGAASPMSHLAPSGTCAMTTARC